MQKGEKRYVVEQGILYEDTIVELNGSNGSVPATVWVRTAKGRNPTLLYTIIGIDHEGFLTVDAAIMDSVRLYEEKKTKYMRRLRHLDSRISRLIDRNFAEKARAMFQPKKEV